MFYLKINMYIKITMGKKKYDQNNYNNYKFLETQFINPTLMLIFTKINNNFFIFQSQINICMI